MDGVVKEAEGTQKRNSLEDLSKEDLIKKCKNLLVIAQRAKQAKDEAGEEVKELKEQLDTLKMKYEQIGNGDKNYNLEWKETEQQLQSQINAMQEMLGTLTEQKLQFTMEIDSLKKQNALLEKQLNQLKIEEDNIRKSSIQLQCRVEELETASESYKRQNHRLTNENETLIQQMETLEIEMRKKGEQTSEINSDQMNKLKNQLQVLHDEVERLTDENIRKKEHMKQLYETFSKEKNELEARLESGRNKHGLEIQNLIKELQAMSKEKEIILIDLKSVKENNNELDKLIQSISAERDAYSLHSSKLNEDRVMMGKHLESIEAENQVIVDENVCLKSENIQLNQLLETRNKEINIVKNENSLLKAEKQEFNEKLHSVTGERDSLSSELRIAECQLQNILHQTLSTLQQCSVLERKDLNESTHSSTLLNVVSSLEKNLSLVFSLVLGNVNMVHTIPNKCRSEELPDPQNYVNEVVTNSISFYDVPSNAHEIICNSNGHGKENLTKLYSELKLLSVTISNVEAQGEFLQAENSELREAVNYLLQLIKKAGVLMPQENDFETQFRANRFVLEENVRTMDNEFHIIKSCSNESICKCSEDLLQLQKEYKLSQKDLETKILELDQVREKLNYLEHSLQFSETEAELRNELNHCRQTLSKKSTELNLVQEELSFVLGKQREFGTVQKVVEKLRNDLVQSNKYVEEKTLELSHAKEELSVLSKQLQNSQSEIEKLQTELITVKEFNSDKTPEKSNTETICSESTCTKLHNELSVPDGVRTDMNSSADIVHKEKESEEQEKVCLKQELPLECSLVEQKSSEREAPKGKLTDAVNRRKNETEILIKLNEEIHELKQKLADKSILLDRSNIEIKTLQEKINQYEKEKINLVSKSIDLYNRVADLKDKESEKSISIKDGDCKLQAMTKEITELNEEKMKLNEDINIKSKLLEEKEKNVKSLRQALEDIKMGSEITEDELQEKIQKLKSEIQNYKFLLDEKSTEIDALNEEFEHVRINSEEVSNRISSELRENLESKEIEIDTLKETLLQAESNLAQSLLKCSVQEEDLISTQNLSKSLNMQVSDLNKLLEGKTIELSNILSNFEEKCSELDNITKMSNDTASELEKLKTELEECQKMKSKSENELNAQISKLHGYYEEKFLEFGNVSTLLRNVSSELEAVKLELEHSRETYSKTETELKKQLLVANNQYNDSVKEIEELKKDTEEYEMSKIVFQAELLETQRKYSEKAKEVENLTEKLHCLQSHHSSILEELRLSRNQYNDVLKELECLKTELHAINEDHEKMQEELRIARDRCDDKAKELENLSSELVNVENVAAEALGCLTAVTAELDSEKEVRLKSTRKLEEMEEQMRDVTANLKVKDEEMQDYLIQLEEAKKCNDFLNSKNQLMTVQLGSLSSSISQLKTVQTGLSEEVCIFQTTVLNTLHQDTWSKIQLAVISYVEAEISGAKRENAELLGEMNEMNQVIKQRGETISKLKEMNSDLEQRLRETKCKLEVAEEDLKTKLILLEAKEKDVQNLELDLAKITETQQQNIDMKDETIRNLEKEVLKFMECQHALETKTSALEAKEEKIHNLEAELIKQTDRLQELKSKDKIIHNLEEELNKLKETVKINIKNEDESNSSDNHILRVKEHEDEISSLKTRIQQLERESEEMRKENGDVQSEAMSSSTISKAEESARLKDIEESFEDRYTKLRIVAVRLKKKVSELTVQQTQLEADKKKLGTDKAELQAKITQLSAQAKNMQTMQQEYDRLQDELESQKSEVKELTKSLESAISESASIKIQLQECQEQKEYKIKDLEACMKDKHNLEVTNKELSIHILSLKKEKEADNLARKEKEKELKKLEEDLKTGEKKLGEEIEHHKNTRELLEASKQECKKRSVLSLEMEDYERSMADLTQQLTAEKSKFKELETHLETQRDISKGLQEQISLLEQRILSEETRSKEVKEQLNISRTRLAEVEAIALERETAIAELTSQIEQHRDQNENLVLQLSELAVEKQRLVESGRNQQDSLSRQVHVLEEHVSRLKENLAEREAELGDLRAEFGNYKVRAQSVLRQKARPEDAASSFSREDYVEELAQLRQTAEVLRNKLEDASSKLQTLTVENSAIQEDRARVLQRCQELIDTVQDLRTQNSQLQTQLQDMAAEHRESLRSQKLQAETLNQCYKQQLEELEERLQKETSSLKKQLKNAEKQLQGAQQCPPAEGSVPFRLTSQSSDTNVTPGTPSTHVLTTGSHWNSSSVGFIPVKLSGVMHQQDPENRLEISLLEREEGEGSESVDSTSPHLAAPHEHHTELIPLEKLLSSPPEDDNNALTSIAIDASPSAELGRTKEQLVVSECRIRHLTGLLTDTERDLAKLTQQNQVLKEEIRRQQRSVEREQHAQNFEYLKNVILKFVMLQGGDERSRLVPVLNTILKLSPEEANQLNIVAKGGAELQGGGRGWGSYLHLWSGTQ